LDRRQQLLKGGLLGSAATCLIVGVVAGIIVGALSRTLTTCFLGASVALGFCSVILAAVLTSKYVTWEALAGLIIALQGEVFVIYCQVMDMLSSILAGQQ